MKTIDAVAKRLRKNRFLFRNLKTALVGGVAYQEQWAVLQRGMKLQKNLIRRYCYDSQETKY